MSRKKPDKPVQKSVFKRVMRPLLSLVVLDACILLLFLVITGVVRHLSQNSSDILRKQVYTRQGYLQTQMTGKWMDLQDVSSAVTAEARRMIATGRITPEHLDSSGTECSPLLLSVKDRLISTLYSHQLSGLYITFNTHPLDGEPTPKTGISIRDNDPLSAASELQADLLLECAPVQVVQSLTLSTDSAWEQRFKFGPDHPYERWLTDPWNTAVASGGTLDAQDCGLWSIRHSANGEPALTWSMPLILDDGLVIGVIGAEMLPAYLSSQLPTAELDESGVYMLIRCEGDHDDTPENVVVCVVSGKSSSFSVGKQLTLSPGSFDGYLFQQDGVEYQAHLAPLNLYSRHAPFENEHWYVLGAVPTVHLFAFSRQVRIMLTIVIILILVFGLIGAMFTSWHIARPIAALRRELDSADAG